MKVFVSYTSKDPAITDEKLILVESRIKSFSEVFIDRLHNEEGNQRRVDKELSRCDVVLQIISPQYHSEWVQKEILTARKKEKPVIKKAGAGSENKGKVLEERLIVTYSIKYKHFMEHKRTCDLERAQKLINSKNSKRIDLKAKNDIRRYIKSETKDKEGNVASDVANVYSLDEEVIAKEARFDGFYAVSTALDKNKMPVSEIVKINRGRWEIEESFMLMKSELKSRPVFLQNDERIKAHFTTCFMALVLFRIIEKKVNEKLNLTVPAGQLIDTLRNMKITVFDKYYTGAFTRTDVTDALHELTGMRFDCELLTKSSIEKFKKMSKKFS